MPYAPAGQVHLAGQGIHAAHPVQMQQKLYNQEETKRKLLEKQAEIERMKASGLQDKALYDYTFDKDNGINPEMAYAHKYVENWEDMKANSSGLLLWGNVGTGEILLCRLYCQCPSGKRRSGADDKFLPHSEYPDWNAF